jgi:hypothetical protein
MRELAGAIRDASLAFQRMAEAYRENAQAQARGQLQLIELMQTLDRDRAETNALIQRGAEQLEDRGDSVSPSPLGTAPEPPTRPRTRAAARAGSPRRQETTTP